MKNKYLVHYTGSSLQVASIDTTGSLRPESAFAFQYSGSVDLLQFALILDELKALRDSTESYYSEAEFTEGRFMFHKFEGVYL
jgi:hypothetical protein